MSSGFTIFYAWHSDSDEKLNRYFIRDALKEVIEHLGRDSTIEDAPRLDHDTKNVPGIPDITATILEKIESCGIFVADVSLVGNTGEAEEPAPNPNVMLELGYALARVGWQRIITVMNTDLGPPEKLPFDLKTRRWPVHYSIGDFDQKTTRRNLSENLRQAISSIVDGGYLIAPADKPDIRVSVSAGGVFSWEAEPLEPLVIVTIQNHSSRDLFVQRIAFTLVDSPDHAIPFRDYLTREPQQTRKLEPGNSLNFNLSWSTLRGELDIRRLKNVVVLDAIGRVFEGHGEQLRQVIQQLERRVRLGPDPSLTPMG